MSADIASYIKKCPACQVHQRDNNKIELGATQIPNYPFEITAADLFYFNGEDYIVLTDSYSGYIKFQILSEATAENVIQFLKSVFSSNGIPRILETDNGPQFSCQDFKTFSTDWKFKHQTSSPYHPRGNGLAERAVQTAKNILKKCMYDNTDHHMGLLNFMNLPRGKLGSPAKRLYGRDIRSPLPTVISSLVPKTKTADIPQLLKEERQKQANYANKGSKADKELNQGQKIVTRINKKKEWKPAVIINKVHQRSYIISDEEGKLFRRSSCNIKPTEAEIRNPPTNIADFQTPESSFQLSPPRNAKSTPHPSTTNSQPKPSDPDLQNPASTRLQSSSAYTTRYGRTVKPPQRLTYSH
ncbi:uncharacterized protein K02A2.6-like [Eupeodes corollae]|uniref:uncharacterized protein K02A2.6-like n=1 Tax=Eupeodes corollae TaxID=290404 RepID=UPI00248F844B|nr:uncharacterized protein K02A2.6-like [Eupeodes corollae]